ncbi:hypothetical protein PLICRDRAFT_96791 [Plicaturopsis crispa FD-325 SS-3]|nr:hypothetical protein PLICRDRAFT_96791 [Plicaturopsis crispa FD-325 SS-3]
MADNDARNDGGNDDRNDGQQPTGVPSVSPPQQPDRSELVARARAFLSAPQIRQADVPSQRSFLAEKGLDPAEIDALLREIPPPIPVVPPRTYPQPPPSNLPNLLLALVRVFTWVAGGSAALLFIYQRFLLPRITRSNQARISLKLHQKRLLESLTTSATSLKSAQADAFAALPRPNPRAEDPAYSDCKTLEEVVALRQKHEDVPIDAIAVLRCALHGHDGINTEELFETLNSKLPDVTPELQATLWETLSTHPCFTHTQSQSPAADTLIWRYAPPSPPEPTPLLQSLSSLRSSVSSPRPTNTAAQHTLSALSSLTGYITTQAYSLPLSTFPHSALSSSRNLGPQEEEVRREIRALKGLVLNRYVLHPDHHSATSLQNNSLMQLY